MTGLPSHAPLLFEYGTRAKGIAAVQRYGMIQDMQNLHQIPTPLSEYRLQNDSNMSSVHSAAL